MILKVDNVNKYYNDFHAVKNLSFQVEENMIYGILGRNGAGKTTTIRMIMDIYEPEIGNIERNYSPEKVSYLPEERGLYPNLTVKETLNFFGEIKGMSKKQISQAKNYWLERFDLTGWHEKKIEELSKGMQQKVQFIISCFNKPKLLILDEPFSGLDPVNMQIFKDEILKLKKENTTVLFSSHIIEHVEYLSTNVLVIDNGEKVIDGKLSDIKKEYGKKTIFVRYDGKSDKLNNELVKNIDDYGSYAEIFLNDPDKHNKYLNMIAPEVNILEYRIDVPSLKSIFINKVGMIEEGKNDRQMANNI
ncbi:MAG: ATP-binding cassette domain-containing protein [Candidatus Mcinerneyibacterium aminivorans]|uniref:ATP-binding cassette domain-containing protein n=1 Tax=Candidatus Mcinerneyibacterium aminivorans TaxID=2703815 RepID=A0A5D0MHP1_9BACT|nr:MAG: ATP-binding cassette domain-containing protein [Candidatus Mcinerneyibacterium aminivorans]